MLRKRLFPSCTGLRNKFEDGIKIWAKQELPHPDIIELTVAMAEIENFYDIGGRKFDNNEPSKPRLKPKSNGRGNKDEVEKNGEGLRAS
ncbi:hypothetical protein PVK06_012461 [Gossypium arboreum]|uniref:Uncharacterized protein n=1 Tax=Gossypium arboreum TaxID=29729 RepID=A0ABR0QBG9_GOSAR|nr:hypothetical protein PVK06_012461 [Gossypium arboreum]